MLFRWIPNRFMGAITAYGEGPRRVLLSFALVIVAFAAAYWTLGVDLAFSTPIGLEYLVFSVQVFVTVFYGTKQPTVDASPLEASLVASEALPGAVLVALLILTPSRRVHR